MQFAIQLGNQNDLVSVMPFEGCRPTSVCQSPFDSTIYNNETLYISGLKPRKGAE